GLEDELAQQPVTNPYRGDIEISQSGEHHARDARPALADSAHELEPVHSGHQIIGDNEFAFDLLQEFERGRTVGRRVDLVPLANEHAPQGAERHRLVIDYQDHRAEAGLPAAASPV